MYGKQVRTACDSGRVKTKQPNKLAATHPLPQMVLTRNQSRIRSKSKNNRTA